MATVDFASAATRHLEDARRLHVSARYDNALYHSGYVVECAMKAVVQRTGIDPKAYGHKLLKLQRDGLAFASLIAPGCGRYGPPDSDVRAAHEKWSETLRYSRTGDSSKNDADALLAAADRVWARCVGQMFLDGLIEEPR